MSEIELAWAAGFFDGEGWVGVDARGKNSRYVRASVPQRDREALERFVQAVGAGEGRIYWDKINELWLWSATGRVARDVVVRLLPYVSVKRAKIEEVLAFTEGGS